MTVRNRPEPAHSSFLRLGVYIFLLLAITIAVDTALNPHPLFLGLFVLLGVVSLLVTHLWERSLPYICVWGLLIFAFLPLSLDDRLAARVPFVYLVFVFPFAFLTVGQMGRGGLRINWSWRMRVTSVLLGLALVFASLVADAKREALLYGMAWALYGILVMRGTALVSARWNGLRLASNVVAAVAVVSALGIVKYALGGSGSFLVQFYATNPIPSLDNNALPFLTVPVGVLAFALLMREATWMRLLPFLLIAVQVAFSNSRTAWVGMIFGIMVVTAFATKTGARSRIAAWGAVGLLLLGLLAAEMLGYVYFVKVRMIGDVVGMWTGGEVSIYDVQRRTMIQGAREVIQDNFVLGTGLGRDNYINALRRTSIQPRRRTYLVAHNLYLTYFAQLGIIGYLCLLGFFAAISVDLLRARRRVRSAVDRTLLGGLIAGHLAILVMFAGNEFIIAPFPWWFWGLALGLAYGQMRVQPRHTRPHNPSLQAPLPLSASGVKTPDSSKPVTGF